MKRNTQYCSWALREYKKNCKKRKLNSTHEHENDMNTKSNWRSQLWVRCKMFDKECENIELCRVFTQQRCRYYAKNCNRNCKSADGMWSIMNACFIFSHRQCEDCLWIEWKNILKNVKMWKSNSSLNIEHCQYKCEDDMRWKNIHFHIEIQIHRQEKSEWKMMEKKVYWIKKMREKYRKMKSNF